MIVVLEGLNGTGKSATAGPLADALKVPIVRPFRGANADEHLGRDGDDRMARLRQLGIPANTFVDDIYVADILMSMKASAVLDRSMGSAIAYGLLYGDIPDVKRAQELLGEWQTIMRAGSGIVLYVNVTARREVRRQRCDSDGRWKPNAEQEKQLEKWFAHVFRDVALPKVTFDTSDIEPHKIGEAGVKRIKGALGVD
ncbi:MAG: hypothetical protein ACWGQW_00825 [bacterium]